MGCFHFLAIVNSAEMNIEVHVFSFFLFSFFGMCLFELCFSQGVCPVVGLLGHMVVLFLVF